MGSPDYLECLEWRPQYFATELYQLFSAPIPRSRLVLRSLLVPNNLCQICPLNGMTMTYPAWWIGLSGFWIICPIQEIPQTVFSLVLFKNAWGFQRIECIWILDLLTRFSSLRTAPWWSWRLFEVVRSCFSRCVRRCSSHASPRCWVHFLRIWEICFSIVRKRWKRKVRLLAIVIDFCPSMNHKNRMYLPRESPRNLLL